MDGSKTSLERAFELAKTGKYANTAEIKRRLSSEGYDQNQITGSTLQKQLRELIRNALPDSAGN